MLLYLLNRNLSDRETLKHLADYISFEEIICWNFLNWNDIFVYGTVTLVLCLDYFNFIFLQSLCLLPNCLTLWPCVECHKFIYFLFITYVELSHSHCATVTEGLCNVFTSFWNVHSTLLFPFEYMLINSRNFAVRTPAHFSLTF